MKILLIDPGAGTSTADVFNGLLPALQRQGHTVFGYPLAARIDLRMNWLDYLYRRKKKDDASVPKPTYADGIRLAAERALPIALMEHVDWVVIVSGMFFPKEHLYLLRRAGLRVALLLTESPYDDADQAQVAPLANVCWTNERVSVPFLQLAQANTHYLPHAFDPEKHHPEPGPPPATVGQYVGEDSSLPAPTNATAGLRPTGHPANRQSSASPKDTVSAETGIADNAHDQHSTDVPTHDVCFVGTAFRERVEVLSAVDWTGIDLGLYGQWRGLGSTHRLRRYVREGQIPNTKTAALYRRAKIGLNLYRTSKGFSGSEHIIEADSLNPRALELAACGVFHLSDRRAEVDEVFGELVPTFTSAKELEGQIRAWLDRPAERQALAAQLPGAVADRTFDRMALTVTADLERTMAAQETREAVAA